MLKATNQGRFDLRHVKAATNRLCNEHHLSAVDDVEANWPRGVLLLKGVADEVVGSEGKTGSRARGMRNCRALWKSRATAARSEICIQQTTPLPSPSHIRKATGQQTLWSIEWCIVLFTEVGCLYFNLLPISLKKHKPQCRRRPKGLVARADNGRCRDRWIHIRTHHSSTACASKMYAVKKSAACFIES